MGARGLSICFDLRCPRLYLEYGARKATVIYIPSAFTVPTGKAHWEILLRARAIETGSWSSPPPRQDSTRMGTVPMAIR